MGRVIVSSDGVEPSDRADAHAAMQAHENEYIGNDRTASELAGYPA
jgi:hypothetical protein